MREWMVRLCDVLRWLELAYSSGEVGGVVASRGPNRACSLVVGAGPEDALLIIPTGHSTR